MGGGGTWHAVAAHAALSAVVPDELPGLRVEGLYAAHCRREQAQFGGSETQLALADAAMPMLEKLGAPPHV